MAALAILDHEIIKVLLDALSTFEHTRALVKRNERELWCQGRRTTFLPEVIYGERWSGDAWCWVARCIIEMKYLQSLSNRFTNHQILSLPRTEVWALRVLSIATCPSRHFFRTVAGEDQEVSIDRFVEGCMAWSSRLTWKQDTTLQRAQRPMRRSFGMLDFLIKQRKTRALTVFLSWKSYRALLHRLPVGLTHTQRHCVGNHN